MSPAIALILGALSLTAPEVSTDTTRYCHSRAPAALEVLHGPEADFRRAAQLMRRAPLRPYLIRRTSTEWRAPYCERTGNELWDTRLEDSDPSTQGLEFELLPVQLGFTHNSTYPDSRNNGALWAGRGLSGVVTLGATLEWGPLSLAFAPQILYHQNRDFETRKVPLPPGTSPFAHPWLGRMIDWPVRHGGESFSVNDLGQSYIRLDTHGLTLGLSNENLWWGPAAHYPLMMSNSAPGFPHLFLGTSDPVMTPIGGFEVQLIWGRLEESDYFDGDPDNDHRLLASIVLDYEPRWLPGLYLGAARSFLRTIPPEGLSAYEWLIEPYRDIRENPTEDTDGFSDDQLFSIFARWAFPEVGFEVYAEWGREDHWGTWDDLVREPDHSQAYMLGFQKVTEAGAPERWVRIYGELVHLQASLPQYNTRGISSFYTHSRVSQGYTHRGQLLGAGIGPGSDAQILGADLINERGLFGLYLERARYDDDSYYRTWTRFYAMNGHDVEIRAGLRQMIRVGEFDISWRLSRAKRYNRHFLRLDGANWDLLTEHNTHFQLGVSWIPGPRLRRPLAALSSKDRRTTRR